MSRPINMNKRQELAFERWAETQPCFTCGTPACGTPDGYCDCSVISIEYQTAYDAIRQIYNKQEWPKIEDQEHEEYEEEMAEYFGTPNWNEG